MAGRVHRCRVGDHYVSFPHANLLCVTWHAIYITTSWGLREGYPIKVQEVRPIVVISCGTDGWRGAEEVEETLRDNQI